MMYFGKAQCYSIFAVTTQPDSIKYLYLAAFYLFPAKYLLLLHFVSEWLNLSLSFQGNTHPEFNNKTWKHETLHRKKKICQTHRSIMSKS